LWDVAVFKISPISFESYTTVETGTQAISAVTTATLFLERVMPIHLDGSLIDHDAHPVFTPVPIAGWPLAALARIDRGGARGLIADLTFAGVHTRQAAFVLLAAMDLDAPSAFSKRLDIQVDGAEGFGPRFACDVRVRLSPQPMTSVLMMFQPGSCGRQLRSKRPALINLVSSRSLTRARTVVCSTSSSASGAAEGHRRCDIPKS
jgi:hypothetical protein